MNIFFTEDDYRAAESSQSVPVRVARDHRIATAVTVTVNPLTVMQAEEWEESIMTRMPDDNPFSPNRAGIIIIAIITINFGSIQELRTYP